MTDDINRPWSEAAYRLAAALAGSSVCEDCGGDGTVDVLPDDEPVYWSDIADGTYSETCPGCNGTGTR